MSKDIKFLIKHFESSMPINKYDDNVLRLLVYGGAYYIFVTELQKDYNIIEVNERFTSNPISERRIKK